MRELGATQLDYLIDNRSDSNARAVLEDLTLTNGDKVTRLGVACWIVYGRVDAAAADADAYADADAVQGFNQVLYGEIDMQNGLKVIQVPGSYSGWNVTLVGWLRRVGGDEWELLGARTVQRTGNYELDGLVRLAAKGPEKRYKLGRAAVQPEEVHRLLVRRSIPADVDAWAEHCPKPKGWEGTM